MFHRKRASSNPPRPVKTTPNPAASTAAAQAFLANRSSNANLSNSAAAAALRSHTTTPTPVGQVQTKRMVRRGSATSDGNTPARPGALLRRDSGGSMTDRTFRAPSPNKHPDRPASSHGPYPRYEDAAPPPVPALPKNYVLPPPVPQKSDRRAASVEPPERVSSPPPILQGGRGVSLDRGPGYLKAPAGAKAKATSLDTVGELDRASSRGSVNFSRPISPQSSPPTSPLIGNRMRSPPPQNSTNGLALSNGETKRIIGTLQDTAARPVKKKKKVMARGSAEGSHLASGISSGPPSGTAVQTTPHRQTPSVSSTPSPLANASQPIGTNEIPRPTKKKKKAVSAAGSQSQDSSEGVGSAYLSDTDSVTSERGSTSDRLRSYNTIAAGLLAKQPSIVREDREGEEQEERIPGKQTNGQLAQYGTPTTATPADTSKFVSKDRQHNRSASESTNQQTPSSAPSLDLPDFARSASLSPSRAAHFSAQPVYEISEGIKHHPPARSVSPAKSALKHSPSRGHSPAGPVPLSHRQGLAPSEASDSASQFSDDGSRSVPAKKKNVKVSFDDDSVAVGRAASPASGTDSPVIMSPQNKQPKNRSWLDLVREHRQETAVSNSDEDGPMKPTPALPSFGSVRGRPDEPISTPAGQITPNESWARETLRSMTTSTDQVIGSIMSQDAAAKVKTPDTQSYTQHDPKIPLPPEVTSVEGIGYHPDEGDHFDEGIDKKSISSKNNLQGPTNNTDKSISSTEPLIQEPLPGTGLTPVPSIAVEPATPGIEERRAAQEEWLGMPGTFPDNTGVTANEQPPTPSVTEQSPTAPFVEQRAPEITPATAGLSEPEPEAAAAQHDAVSPHVGSLAEGLRNQIDSHSDKGSDETDGGSIYSDAAEDQSDLEGDGFGSINAIVESPAASPTPGVMGGSPPASPSKTTATGKTVRPSPLGRNESELSEPASDEGWDRAQAYWSGLSQTRKQQLERAAATGAVDKSPGSNENLRGVDVKPKKKRKVKKSTPPPESENPPLPPWPDRQYREDTTKAAPLVLRSSMRKPQSENGPETHMRTSMRDRTPPKPSPKDGTQRNSKPQPPQGARAALQKKIRPVSAVAMVDYNKPSSPNQKRAVPAGESPTSLKPVAAAQPKKKSAAALPKLRRATSNDSDSSSSFKKNHVSPPDPNRYSMKRSMRPQSTDGRPQSSTNRASSLINRASSPVGSPVRRPFSSISPGGAPSTMRTSMRGSMDSGKPARTSLRNSMDSSKPARTKSPSRFGFGKSSKPKSLEPKPASRFSSRFGDSSDEDGGLPAMGTSRFAESSDEDEPSRLTPVRGIPRRIDEGDSTDLEDSDEDIAAPSSKTKTNRTVQPALSTKPEGAALATGSLRTATEANGVSMKAMGTGLATKKVAEKEKEKKKRSFFGGFGSKKQTETRQDTKQTPMISGLSTPSRPQNERVLGPSSPTADPAASSSTPTKTNGPKSPVSTSPSSPKPPKLQRRNTPKRLSSANDISWPLPQSPGGTPTSGGGDIRPRTSDGPVKSGGLGGLGREVGGLTGSGGRPEMGGRMQSEGVVVGKKKRFPMLRKAFGLHD